MTNIKNRKNIAFSVVELLVVIVVIGILASVVIFALRNVNKDAITSVETNDLNGSSKMLKLYATQYGSFPTALDVKGCPTAPVVDSDYCVKTSKGNTSVYWGDGQHYTLNINNTSTSIATRVNESELVTPVVTTNTFANTWGKAGDDKGEGIAKTSDGGVVVTGYTNSAGAGGYDMFIAKYDASGNLTWNKTWGGNCDDYGFSVVQASDGGYLATGETCTYGVEGDVFIVKYDSAGNFLWNKIWGGADEEWANSIINTSDGGFVVDGATYSFGSSGSADIFILKYDASGNLIWNKTWGGSEWESPVSANSIIQTSDNGYALTAITYSYGAGESDLVLLKFDSSGNLTWNKTWGSGTYDGGFSVLQTADSGYLVTGYSDYNLSYDNMLLVKFTSTGTVSWSKTWGGNDYYSEAYSITKVSDGGYVVMGEIENPNDGWYGDIAMTKFSSTGIMQWVKYWGKDGINEGSTYSVAAMSDGGFAAVGYTDSYGGGSHDSAILRFSNSGDIANCPTTTCKFGGLPIRDVSITAGTPSVVLGNPLASVSSPSATTGNPSGMNIKMF